MRINAFLMAAILALTTAQFATARTYYVDNQLSSDITNGTYSIANRNGGTGSDGNAYKSIKNGIAAQASGDVMNIRGGTYNESYANTGVGSPGNFAAMTYIQAYNGENVVWRNASPNLGDIVNIDNTNNVTIKGINFRGRMYVPINEYTWTVYSGKVWQTTSFQYELTEFKWANNLGQRDGIPVKTSTGALVADGDWYQQRHVSGGSNTIYLYSNTNPNSRTDLVNNGQGSSIHGSDNNPNTYMVLDSCTFDGAPHVHVLANKKLWVHDCYFINGGLDSNDHHFYLHKHSEDGDESIYEHNYFDFVNGQGGASLHFYDGGAGQIRGHIVRNNVFKMSGSDWGLALYAQYIYVYNNSFSGGKWAGVFGQPSTATPNPQNVYIQNNAFGPMSGPQPFSCNSSPKNCTVTNNVAAANAMYTGSWGTGCTISNNTVNTNPGYANANPTTWSDFKLAAGSPCIDAGVNLGAAHKWALDPRGTTWPASVVDQTLHGSAWEIGAFAYVKAPVGRYVFYNNSKFDGNDPAANAADDGAIATDKTPLLPGGTAKFANYTSYTRGINGIMIDIAGLPAGTPTAADFTFKVGNDNTPSAWATAPAPSTITVRRGAGTGGSDRITILWADNAIQKQWLQVTVLANTRTGLTAADVFYWGNAIGDTGNSTTDAQVTPADEIVVRNNPHTLQQNPAPITDTCDFTRDGKVGPTDEVIVRNNATNASTALKLITAP